MAKHKTAAKNRITSQPAVAAPVVTDTATSLPQDIASAIVAKAVEAVTPKPTKSAKPSLTQRRAARPKVCGDMPGAADVTCKRLPAHKGDHRTTLFAPAVAKVKAAKVKATAKATTKSSKRVTKGGKAQSLKGLKAALDAAVASGDMTASTALSILSAAIG